MGCSLPWRLVKPGARSGSSASCRNLPEIAHPHQVIDRRGDGKEPADSPHAPEFDFAEQADRFQPAEDLFDSFPFLLTDRVAEVPRGATINRTGTVRRMLGPMGRDLPCPQCLYE